MILSSQDSIRVNISIRVMTLSQKNIQENPKIGESRFGVVILTIPKMITLKTGKDQDRGIPRQEMSNTVNVKITSPDSGNPQNLRILKTGIV